MTERRRLERHQMSSSLEVFDLDTGDHLGRVVDLHEEGLMLLSNRPVDLNRAFSLQVNLPMTLNGVNEFLLDAESLWNRVSINGEQFWTGMHFIDLPGLLRQCISKMVASR